jgi:hypothetical protein
MDLTSAEWVGPDGFRETVTGAHGIGLERFDLPGARLQRLALTRERVEGCKMFRDAGAVDGGHHGSCPVCARQRLEVVGIEEQSPVPGASKLVELDEAGLDIGQVYVGLTRQLARARLGLVQLRLRLEAIPPDLCQLLDADLPIQFELSQLDQQRALLRREGVGLLLQRPQAFGRPFRRRVEALTIDGA